MRLSDNIGNTPLIKISEKIYAKAELLNPTGSIKDRMAIKELMLTLEPVIFGVIKFPSKNCINPKMAITPKAYQALSFVARAIRAGISEPIKIPI